MTKKHITPAQPLVYCDNAGLVHAVVAYLLDDDDQVSILLSSGQIISAAVPLRVVPATALAAFKEEQQGLYEFQKARGEVYYWDSDPASWNRKFDAFCSAGAPAAAAAVPVPRSASPAVPAPDGPSPEQLRVASLLRKDLADSGISLRVYNVLSLAGIHTYRDLVSKNRLEVLNLKNMGQTLLSEVDAMLKDRGLAFDMDLSEYPERQ